MKRSARESYLYEAFAIGSKLGRSDPDRLMRIQLLLGSDLVEATKKAASSIEGREKVEKK